MNNLSPKLLDVICGKIENNVLIWIFNIEMETTGVFFLTPLLMILSDWIKIPIPLKKPQSKIPDSFYTKTRGCNSAEERVRIRY